MNYYEKVLILDANLEDSVAEETVTRITDMITKPMRSTVRLIGSPFLPGPGPSRWESPG